MKLTICVKEGKRELKEGEKGMERERERESVYVCVKDNEKRRVSERELQLSEH